MLFNSIDFAVFLPVVFILYWFGTNQKASVQNLVIVLASFVFYGWWDWRFLFLLVTSALVDFSVARMLKKQDDPRKRKALLSISIVVNLGLLGFFKYYNFFVDSFVAAFSFFGQPIMVNTLDIVLPVGISFYTFQTLSYAIDVYKRRLEPTSDLSAFFAYVSFFPQLVAGPIERATHLLPQFYERRVFDKDEAVNGLKQMLWGFFKKIVIADRCATYVDTIFNQSDAYGGSTLAIGAVLFAFQIYCDFSGYSDIAIGTARLFGFGLVRNFAFPYFSRDMSEFWRRWHISLSTWFRDYVYIPLGGGKEGKWKKVRNTFIVFLLSGLWHGANWTFIVWGLLHALLVMPLVFVDDRKKNLDTVAQGKLLPPWRDVLKMTITFALTVFTWIFFRAENITHALSYIAGIFSSSLFTVPEMNFRYVLLLIVAFVGVEWLGRENQYAIEKIGITWPRIARWSLYYSIILMIYFFGIFSKNIDFIYFQF